MAPQSKRWGVGKKMAGRRLPSRRATGFARRVWKFHAAIEAFRWRRFFFCGLVRESRPNPLSLKIGDWGLQTDWDFQKPSSPCWIPTSSTRKKKQKRDSQNAQHWTKNQKNSRPAAVSKLYLFLFSAWLTPRQHWNVDISIVKLSDFVNLSDYTPVRFRNPSRTNRSTEVKANYHSFSKSHFRHFDCRYDHHTIILTAVTFRPNYHTPVIATLNIDIVARPLYCFCLPLPRPPLPPLTSDYPHLPQVWLSVKSIHTSTSAWLMICVFSMWYVSFHPSIMYFWESKCIGSWVCVYPAKSSGLFNVMGNDGKCLIWWKGYKY